MNLLADRFEIAENEAVNIIDAMMKKGWRNYEYSAKQRCF